MKGEIGRRIYHSISQEAWSLWIRQSVMLINEYRLNPTESSAQKILRDQMENFFFAGGAAPPPDFVPENK